MKFIGLLISKVISKLKDFLTWLDLSNCMNTPQERHAFIEGLADGFCLSKSYYMLWDQGKDDINLLESLRREHHYYNAGRSLGFAAFVVLVSGMIVWMVNSFMRV